MRANCFLTAVGVCLLAAGGSAGEPAAKGSAKPKPARPKITISKETTYITGPLRPDGYPDYLAALNELTSRGVTPENNAAVPFWRAVGPKSIPAELRQQFFKLLGIEELPEKGAYMVHSYEFLRAKNGRGDGGADTPEESALMDRVFEQQDIAQRKPWSASEFPELAEWIAASEAPLRIICEGAKRPKFYRPLVIKDGAPILDGCLTYDGIWPRAVVRMLTARAMFRVKAGKIDEAWQDILACKRLGRVTAQGPLLVDQLIGGAMTFAFLNGPLHLTFAHEVNLDAKQASKCLADLQSLPPWPSAADRWDVGERCFFLGYVIEAAQARGMPPSLRNVGELSPDEQAVQDAMSQLACDPRLDWDEALRSTNAAVDQWRDAWRLPSYQQRRKAVAAIADAIAAEAHKAVDPVNLKRLSAKDASPRALGKNLAAILSGTAFRGCAGLLYAPHHAEAELSLMKLAFALAGYRADHGEYPPSLAELKPKYIAEIPKDAFSDKDLVYKPHDGRKGYVLYSFGKNGRDDGGESHFDNPEKYENVEPDERPDDIVIRTPAAADRGKKP